MTRQQAGVSAEAVAKLLKLWLDCFADGGLVVNEARKESWYETNLVQPTRAALAIAPPEQAHVLNLKELPNKSDEERAEEFMDCDYDSHDDCVKWLAANFADVRRIALNPPQAASAGALRSDNEYVHAFQLANRVLERTNADPDDDLAVLARQFLRANERAIAEHSGAAAHDQKVRAEVCERAATIVHQWLHTVDAREKLTKAIRSLAAPAPAASKPEADNE